MKLAYLTGQYPKVSHTFIRREIHALEARGHAILRLSVREPDSGIADPLDRAERERTRTFFTAPRSAWLAAFARRALRRPGAMLGELGRVIASLVRPGPGPIPRCAYWVEACYFLGLIEAEGVEHVHVHFGRNGVSVAQIMQRLGGPGFSMTVHGPDEFDDPRGFELREKAHDAAFTVGISAYTTAQLRRWVDPADWSKLAIVRCSVDESFFAEASPSPPGPRRFVCVGRLCAQKGQLLLLEAFARVAAREADVRLVLAGDGELRGAVEAAARRLGIAERVEITGWIAESVVREQLRAAFCMVLPSFAEGLPVVIMEALAMRRPVLSTFIAGIPELVDADCGWLVPAGDVEALADAMTRALATPAGVLDAMGERGAAHVRERHFAAREAERLERLLLGCGPGSRAR